MRKTGKLAVAAAALPFVWWTLAGIVYGSGVVGDAFMLFSIVSLFAMFYVAAVIGYRTGKTEARGR